MEINLSIVTQRAKDPMKLRSVFMKAWNVAEHLEEGDIVEVAEFFSAQEGEAMKM